MIVVFGAAGFIGTYLIDQLIADGHHVAGSDISDVANAHFSVRKVPFHRIDITQQQQFDKLPAQAVDAVVHLACVQPANVSEQQYNPLDYVRVNVIGTLNILEYCRVNSIPKIIYTCSHRNTQGMWAAKAGSPIGEKDGRSIKFTGDYAMFSISESAATDCIEHYAQTYGIEGVTFRLPPVYGYGPHTEIFKDGKPLKTGFQIFVEQAEKSETITLWGDAGAGRDIVYVKDVVTAIGLALEKSDIGGLYNISSGRRLSLKEQAEAIIRVFSPPGRPSQLRYEPDKPNLLKSYLYDIGKAERMLGWRPRYSFEDMLVDYAKEKASRRFEFLVEKRRQQLRRAAAEA